MLSRQTERIAWATLAFDEQESDEGDLLENLEYFLLFGFQLCCRGIFIALFWKVHARSMALL